MHKVPLAAKGLVPVSAAPVVLLDYKQVFKSFSKAGEAYATLQKSVGDSSHGVLFELPYAFLTKLDEIQQGYTRQSGVAQMYNGTEHPCILYVWKPMDCEEGRSNAACPTGTELPSQQYLDTMAEGLEMFGGRLEAVQALRKLQATPRKPLSAYISVPSPLENVTMTYPELLSMDGKNGKPLMGCINGKVVEFNGELQTPSSDRFRRVMRDYPMQLGFKDAAPAIAAIAFDPIFGTVPPTSLSEMSQIHIRYAEDFFMHRFSNTIVVKGYCSEENTE
jgi:hypothetical protein